MRFSLRDLGVAFDDRRLLSSLDKATARAMVRIGGFIRNVAKRSMRKGGKKQRSSAPGQPPRRQDNTIYNLTFYAYGRATGEVVVGPVGLNSSKVPALHEFGGTVRRVNRSGKAYEAKYPPRPYMRPALEKARQDNRLAEAWRNTLRP